MALWYVLQRWAKKNLSALTWQNFLILIALYCLLAWLLLSCAGETELTQPWSTFFYFLIVTASTVGYGDLSPSTTFGHWVVSLFVIPGGVSLFAMLLGRMAQFFVTSWRKAVTGRKYLKMENHILVIGWHEQRTLSLLHMLLHEEEGRRPIVLCTKADIENPLPGKIDFVRVTNYTCEHTMPRANIEKASCFVVDTLADDITLTAALFVANLNPKADLIAYFEDTSLSRLLKLHCPKAECVPSVSVELLAKSAVDPGSSKLHQELIRADKGMTQYAAIYPKKAEKIKVSDVFLYLKEQHDAILIALDHGAGIELNPSLDAYIQPGSKVFYIADERVDDLSWPEVNNDNPSLDEKDSE